MTDSVGELPGGGSLVPVVGSIVAPIGSLVGSLGAPVGSLGVLVPIALVGGSIAAGAAAMPAIEQSLAGGGVQLPPLPALPEIPGVDTGSLPGQPGKAPAQQPVDGTPQAPGPTNPNGRG
ncbi:hypothetical protein [Dietzia sp. 179-F 9C3 NHS]|uniref:hypothetical protein n=1 Tax=Dietzia sp. 179-F 9C3 NHS TaxID=3374295 RepID=UPI0038792272